MVAGNERMLQLARVRKPRKSGTLRRVLLRVCLLGGAGAPPVWAHVDTTSAVSIGLHPTQESTLTVTTNFGTLLSHDAGTTFRWVCDGALSGFDTSDTRVWLSNGSLLASSFGDGLLVSDDGGCSFRTAPGTEGSVVVAAVEYDGGVLAARWASGTSLSSEILWSPLGNLSFDVVATFDSGLVAELAVAPGDGDRAYAMVLDARAGEASLWRSDGVADAWKVTGATVASAVLEQPLLVVHPERPEVVYFTSGQRDRLFVTRDAGATFAALFEPPDGFVTALTVGESGRVWLAGGDGQLFSGAPESPSFGPVATSPHVGCLRAHGAGLYYCASRAEDGHVVGWHSGGTFEPLLAWFSDVEGPLQCPSGTPVHDDGYCASYWPTLEGAFKGHDPAHEAANGESISGSGCALTPASTPGLSCVSGFALLVFHAWRRRHRCALGPRESLDADKRRVKS